MRRAVHIHFEDALAHPSLGEHHAVLMRHGFVQHGPLRHISQVTAAPGMYRRGYAIHGHTYSHHKIGVVHSYVNNQGRPHWISHSSRTSVEGKTPRGLHNHLAELHKLIK